MHNDHKGTDAPRREGSQLVISYLTLRKLVGLLGLALPSLLVLVHAVVVPREVLPSLSAYYHSELAPLFVGILCTIAAFLLSYQGYRRSDHLASVLAGLGCLGVALLPHAPSGAGEWLGALDVGLAHYLCAALFLASLTYISLFEFTRTRAKGRETPRKLQRNRVYRAMGGTMAASLLVLVADGVWVRSGHASFLPPAGVLVGEAIAVVAFAVSWLTKGEMFLKDREQRRAGGRFLCLAYGDEAGWNALDAARKEEVLAADAAIRARGNLMGPVAQEVRTVTNWTGTPQVRPQPYAQHALPLAGFSLIHADSIDEVLQLVARTPCAVAQGHIEVRPLLPGH